MIYSLNCLSYALMLVLALTACGSGSLPTSKGNRSSGDQSNPPTESVNPPVAYYESAMATEFDLLFGATKAVDRKQTLYFNLDGGEVVKGFTAGKSFLICADTVQIPKADLGKDDRKDVEFYVKNYFEQSYPELVVTFAQPSAGPYTTIFVTSHYGALGCPAADIKFHAPFDKENISYGDVAFAFKDAADDLNDLVTQIETAAERTLGIEGQNQLVGGGVTPQEKLKALDEIHSMSRLLLELQDKDVLDIAPLHAELDATVPGGRKHLTGFDRIITVTVGVSENQGNSGNNNNNGGGLVSWLGGLLSGAAAGASNGNAAGVISAVAILAGRPEIAIAATVLGPLLGAAVNNTGGAAAGNGGGSGGDEAQPEKALIPRYDSVLTIEGQATLAAMLDDLRGHAQFVNQEYEGKIAQSLHSLLVVAYSQAFREHIAGGQPPAADTP
jgi:hypothetical protein